MICAEQAGVNPLDSRCLTLLCFVLIPPLGTGPYSTMMGGKCIFTGEAMTSKIYFACGDTVAAEVIRQSYFDCEVGVTQPGYATQCPVLQLGTAFVTLARHHDHLIESARAVLHRIAASDRQHCWCVTLPLDGVSTLRRILPVQCTYFDACHCSWDWRTLC